MTGNVVKAGHFVAKMRARASDNGLLAQKEPIVSADDEATQTRDLAAELEAAYAEIDGLKQNLEVARKEAFDSGVEHRLKEAKTNEDVSLAQIKAIGLQTRDSVRTALADAEKLAIEIALAGLEKMLGEVIPKGEAVALIIKQQLRALEKALVIAVEVSAEDFAGEAQITALAERTGLDRDAIKLRPDLAKGACQIQLRLGAIDAGLDGQWARLNAVLAGGS